MHKSPLRTTKFVLDFRISPPVVRCSFQRRTASSAAALARSPVQVQEHEHEQEHEQEHYTPPAPDAVKKAYVSRYANFKKIEASRQDFDPSLPIIITKTPKPNWKYGDAAKDATSNEEQHVGIDPFHRDRPTVSNYRLLVSAIARPTSLISTVSKNGKRNLAPFSYFQLMDHDPPTFVVAFTAGRERMKDTRRNLEETGHCVISLVSDHMAEGMNATALDIPYETSEWEMSGFNGAPSSTVKPDRVKEAIFSIEAKLLEMKVLDYQGQAKLGHETGAIGILEATKFWVRKDALNEAMDDVNLSVMRPLVSLGGIQYGRVRETFELPRPAMERELANKEKGLAKFLE